MLHVAPMLRRAAATATLLLCLQSALVLSSDHPSRVHACMSIAASPVVVLTGQGSLSMALAAQLHAADVKVVALDSHARGGKGFSLVEGSPTNASDIHLLFKEARTLGSIVAVIHLAPETSDECAAATPSSCLAHMRDSTRLILLAAKEHRSEECAPILVLGSTVEVYDRSSPAQTVTESSPLNPSSAFGRAKLAAESILLDDSGDPAFAAAFILRFSTLFGHLSDSSTSRIASIVRSFLSRETLIDIDQSDDYILAWDAASFIHKLLLKPSHSSGVTVLNVGAGRLTSTSSIIAALSNMLDRPFPPILRQIPFLHKTGIQLDVTSATTLVNSSISSSFIGGLHSYVKAIIDHDIDHLKHRKANECDRETTEHLHNLDQCLVHIHEYPVTQFGSYGFNFSTSRFFHQKSLEKPLFSFPDHRCCWLVSTGNPSTLEGSPRLKELVSSPMYQMADFYLESVDRSQRTDFTVTIVYNSAQRSVVILRTDTEGVAPDFQPISSSIAFVFAMLPVSCSRTSSLPFLKRSAGIYQSKAFRESEETRRDSSSHYGVECRRIVRAISFRQSLQTRLNSVQTLSLNHSVPLESLFQSGRTTSALDFGSFTSKPPCDYDCNLKLVCLENSHCKCITPHICQQSAYTIDLQQSSSSFEGSLTLSDKVRSTSLSTVQRISTEQLSALASTYPVKLHVWSGPESDIFSTRNRRLVEPSCDPKYREKYFNADQMLWYIGLGTMDTSVEDADYVLVPYWHRYAIIKPWYPRPDALESVIRNASDLSSRKVGSKLVFTLTYDYGACFTFLWEEFSMNAKPEVNRQPNPFSGSYVFNINGDFNTNCAVPEKDVIISAVSCKSDAYRKSVGNIDNVIPSCERKYLLFFAGKHWGYGRFARDRVSYKSLFPRTWLSTTFVHAGVNPDSPKMNYEMMLRNSKFCLLLRGVVGWSQRISQAVYNGCIPVVSIDMTHLPYNDIIDYSSFCIFIEENRIDSIESILLDVTPAAMELMQVRALRVREAFMYNNSDTTSKYQTRSDAFAYSVNSLTIKANTFYFREVSA